MQFQFFSAANQHVVVHTGKSCFFTLAALGQLPPYPKYCPARTESGDPNKHMPLHLSQKQAFETEACMLAAQPSPAELLSGVVFSTYIALYTRTASTATVLLRKR